MNLERKMPVLILFTEKRRCCAFKLRRRHNIHDADGADADNAENKLQTLDDLVVIVLLVAVDENTPGCSRNAEFPLAALERELDLVTELFLKEITVFAFNSDLRVFN